MATNEELEQYLANERLFEGEIPWMYLDNAKQSNVTCGYGFLVPNEQATLSYVWEKDGRPATDDEVKEEFRRIRAMSPGMSAAHYKGSLLMDQENMVAHGIGHLTSYCIPQILKHCPGFESMPIGVRNCLVDIEWNVIGGVGAFPSLCLFCNSGDWAMAAPQSHVSTSRDSRNKWRYDSIYSAVGS